MCFACWRLVLLTASSVRAHGASSQGQPQKAEQDNCRNSKRTITEIGQRQKQQKDTQGKSTRNSRETNTRQAQTQPDPIAETSMVQAQKQVELKHKRNQNITRKMGKDKPGHKQRRTFEVHMYSTGADLVLLRCSPGAAAVQHQDNSLLPGPAQPRSHICKTLVLSRCSPGTAPVPEWCSRSTIPEHRPGTASVQFAGAALAQIRYSIGAGPALPRNSTCTASV